MRADRFLLVTGTAQATRDADWIRRNLPEDAHATLTDVTSAYAVIAVMGPRARDLLARLTKAPLDNAAFPFGAIREIGIGYATVLASRRTYVGELGWELYVPAEFAAGVYDALMRGGRGSRRAQRRLLRDRVAAAGERLSRLGPRADAGLQSLRGRAFGFAVKLDKGDFIGRDALLAAKGKPPARRLLSFVATSPDTPIAHGGELILRNGEPAGEVTSAAYGHTVGGIVALGYVATGGDAGR